MTIADSLHTNSGRSSSTYISQLAAKVFTLEGIIALRDIQFLTSIPGTPWKIGSELAEGRDRRWWVGVTHRVTVHGYHIFLAINSLRIALGGPYLLQGLHYHY